MKKDITYEASVIVPSASSQSILVNVEYGVSEKPKGNNTNRDTNNNYNNKNLKLSKI